MVVHISLACMHALIMEICYTHKRHLCVDIGVQLYNMVA